MSRFFSGRFQRLEAYVPGEQPQDMQYVKLNTNESPYPPSPETVEAVSRAEVEKLKLYSDPECRGLVQKLADFYGVGPENVFVSNGSDESLNFFFMAFCDAETGVAFPAISYGFYEVFAQLHNLDYQKIPLQKDFTVRVADYEGLGRNIVIANPNAPTGIALSLDEIERIVTSNPENVVVIDEAYVDFGGESAVSLTKKYDNLLVIQTYSKSRSMAGARLGYAIGHEALIRDMNTLRYSTNPYNVNRLTLTAGIAAIESNGYYAENCRRIMETREYTARALAERGFTVLPSKANFLFAMHSGISGGALYAELKKKGVLIRHFSKPEIADYNRITIGSREQMDILLEKIDEILKEQKGGKGE